jgi:hypothetical protein
MSVIRRTRAAGSVTLGRPRASKRQPSRGRRRSRPRSPGPWGGARCRRGEVAGDEGQERRRGGQGAGGDDGRGLRRRGSARWSRTVTGSAELARGGAQERAFAAVGFDQRDAGAPLSAARTAMTRPGKPPPEPRSAQVGAPRAQGPELGGVGDVARPEVGDRGGATRLIAPSSGGPAPRGLEPLQGRGGRSRPGRSRVTVMRRGRPCAS